MFTIAMLTLVGFVLTAQTAKAWPNNMIRDTYMPHVPVKRVKRQTVRRLDRDVFPVPT